MLWKIEDGLKLIRVLQPDAHKLGFHITLGGSVLNEGVSKKDLDLFFLPRNDADHPNPSGIIEWLTKLWGAPLDIGVYRRALEVEQPKGAMPAWNIAPDAYEMEREILVAFNRVQPQPLIPVAPPVPVQYDDVQANRRIMFNLPDPYKVPIKAAPAVKAPPTPEVADIYRYKFKFIRHNEDRVDVFIV